MKTNKKYLITLSFTLFTLVIFAFSGCMNPGSMPQSYSSSKISAKAVPTAAESIELSVSGPDMAAITKSIDPGENSFTLQVPSGNNRIFQMNISTLTSSFKGSKTANLKAGAIANISIPMALSGLKLVVPDYYTGRLVQIDDITGTGWIEKTESDYVLGTGEQLAVTDIAYDQFGRLYTTVFNSSAQEARIIRLNSIGELDTSFEMTSVNNVSSPIGALAVDRNNNKIFFSYEDIDYVTHLASVDFLGGSLTDYNFTTQFGAQYEPITGLATDNSGWIHIVMNSGSDWPGFVSYHPADQTKKDYYILPDAHDVMVSGQYIYIADPYSNLDTAVKLARVPLDYASDTNPETVTDDPDSTDTFNGPFRFIHTLTDDLYILDEPTTGELDDGRLIRFELDSANFPGSKWTTFKAQDVGKTSFDYYAAF